MAMTGTWVMGDVRVAVKRGYSLIGVQECNEYEVTRCDPRRRSRAFRQIQGHVPQFQGGRERLTQVGADLHG